MTTQPVPTDAASPSVASSPPIVTTRNAVDSDALAGVDAFAYAFLAVLALYFLGRYRVRRFLAKSSRAIAQRPDGPDVRNPFEAGRRIALALQATVLALGIGAVGIAYLTSYPIVDLQTDGPDDSWRLLRGDCSLDAASEWRSNVALPGGRRANVRFCFQPGFYNEGGGTGIPYESTDEAGTYMLNDSFSPVVTAYTRSRANNFYPGRELADEIASRSRELTNRTVMEATYIAGLAIGIAWLIIWAVTFSIGWVIRGARGIPLGSDYAAPARNGPAASSEESGDGVDFE